jgi:hypothetical protein
MNLLHIRFEFGELLNQDSPRIDLSQDEEFLQISSLRIEKNKSFNAHKHLPKKTDFENYTAQESWVVISGKILVTYFDVDDSFLCNKTIGQGDVSITFRGGHSYQAIDGEALVYEFKSGPYRGATADKSPINFPSL